MEKVVNAVASVSSYNGTPVRTGNWLSEHETVEMRLRKRGEQTHMTFPMSLNKAPGLHNLMASSRQSRVVRINFRDSSSTLPTG